MVPHEKLILKYILCSDYMDELLAHKTGILISDRKFLKLAIDIKSLLTILEKIDSTLEHYYTVRDSI